MCACVEYYLINTNIVAESNHLNIKFIIMCNYQKMNPQPSTQNQRCARAKCSPCTACMATGDLVSLPF
jgi:hypothetical protein